MIKDTFKKIGDQCTCISPSEQIENPSYIHLKNTNFCDGQAKIPYGNTGTWWRGRISEVQGFTSGKLIK